MAAHGLKVSLDAGREAAAVFARMADWPLSLRQTFLADWKALEAAGAELVDVTPPDSEGRMATHLGADFVAFLREYGVEV